MLQLCVCIKEPMGRCGLEGYVKGNTYFFEYKEKDKKGRPYIRVYPDCANDNYYETCGTGTFEEHFKTITEPDEDDQTAINLMNSLRDMRNGKNKE